VDFFDQKRYIISINPLSFMSSWSIFSLIAVLVGAISAGVFFALKRIQKKDRRLSYYSEEGEEIPLGI
jgi:uncharacterized membrane protein